MVALAFTDPCCLVGASVVESTVSFFTWLLWGVAMDVAIVLACWKIVAVLT